MKIALRSLWCRLSFARILKSLSKMLIFSSQINLLFKSKSAQGSHCLSLDFHINSEFTLNGNAIDLTIGRKQSAHLICLPSFIHSSDGSRQSLPFLGLHFITEVILNAFYWNQMVDLPKAQSLPPWHFITIHLSATSTSNSTKTNFSSSHIVGAFSWDETASKVLIYDFRMQNEHVTFWEAKLWIQCDSSLPVTTSHWKFSANYHEGAIHFLRLSSSLSHT